MYIILLIFYLFFTPFFLHQYFSDVILNTILKIPEL